MSGLKKSNLEEYYRRRGMDTPEKTVYNYPMKKKEKSELKEKIKKKREFEKNSKKIKIEDLCEEEKLKIGKLIKKLAEEKNEKILLQKKIKKKEIIFEKKILRISREKTRLNKRSLILEERYKRNFDLFKKLEKKKNLKFEGKNNFENEKKIEYENNNNYICENTKRSKKKFIYENEEEKKNGTKTSLDKEMKKKIGFSNFSIISQNKSLVIKKEGKTKEKKFDKKNTNYNILNLKDNKFNKNSNLDFENTKDKISSQNLEKNYYNEKIEKSNYKKNFENRYLIKNRNLGRNNKNKNFESNYEIKNLEKKRKFLNYQNSLNCEDDEFLKEEDKLKTFKKKKIPPTRKKSKRKLMKIKKGESLQKI